MKPTVILVALLCLAARALPPCDAEERSDTAWTGNATYYADHFQERMTASGIPYDRDKFTCAHRTLPFGTRLRVTNPRNGKSVEVVVTDRGPFNAHLSIDLSRAAAREIGLFSQGVMRVRYSIIAPIPKRQSTLAFPVWP